MGPGNGRYEMLRTLNSRIFKLLFAVISMWFLSSISEMLQKVEAIQGYEHLIATLQTVQLPHQHLLVTVRASCHLKAKCICRV